MSAGRCFSVFSAVVLVVAALLQVGCEDSELSTGADPATTLTITPAQVDLVGQTNGVVLTADISLTGTNQTLFFPLEWSVSNPGLGSITQQGTVEAVYQGTGIVGGNIVTVRDQGGREAFAVVNRL